MDVHSNIGEEGMSNKREKAVLDHMHNNRQALESHLGTLASNNNLSGVKNFSRTVDHQVTELELLRKDLLSHNLDKASTAAGVAKHCFADLSRMLRDCSKSGSKINIEQAKTSLNKGFKAVEEVANQVHSKDAQHQKHTHTPRVKYNPKKKEENKEAAAER